MIGTELKHYRVGKTLGKGGMGVVYQGFDAKLQRQVALKILPEKFVSDEERRGRFLQEARANGSITHPAIAQVYEVDEADGVVFMAMELIDGRNVTQLIAARELDVLGAVDVAIQVAQGLAKAHEFGIVHRDIKSDNIMVNVEGQAKILDFGLAKLVERSLAGEPSADLTEKETIAMTQTQAGMVLGTVAFMSPEQARAEPVDPRSDIFSLGVVLYHMATGQLPFGGNSAIDTMHAIVYEEIRPLAQTRAGLPASLDRVISRCLRKRPADRFANAEQLIDALKSVQHEIESGISTTVPLSEQIHDRIEAVRRLDPMHWAWLALAAAALGALIFLGLTKWDSPPLLFFAFMAWIAFSSLTKRPKRLLERFAASAGSVPEVRMVLGHEREVTVIVDQAVARTYVRLNNQLDRINGKWFTGRRFALNVQSDIDGVELRRMLSGARVLFVREDLLDEKV